MSSLRVAVIIPTSRGSQDVLMLIEKNTLYKQIPQKE